MKNLKVLSTFLIIILVLQFKSMPVHAVQCTSTGSCVCNSNADCNHGLCYSPGTTNSSCQCLKDAAGNYYGGTNCSQLVCNCTCKPPQSFCIGNTQTGGPPGCFINGAPFPTPYFPSSKCTAPTRLISDKQSDKFLSKELTGTWLGEIPSPSTTGTNEQFVLKLCIRGNVIDATANSPSLFKDAKYDSSEVASNENTFVLSLKNNIGDVVEILITFTEEKKLNVLLHDGRSFTMEKIDKFKDCGFGKRKG